MIISLIKAALFGLAAGLIACYKGISVGGGPAGVGNAVNETVVYTFVALFAINIVTTAISVQTAGGRYEHQHSCHPSSRRPARAARGWADGWNRIGTQTQFYGQTLGSIGDAVVHYRTEMVRLIAQMGLGAGALAVIGGTVVIVGFPDADDRRPGRRAGLQPVLRDRRRRR